MRAGNVFSVESVCVSVASTNDLTCDAPSEKMPALAPARAREILTFLIDRAKQKGVALVPAGRAKNAPSSASLFHTKHEREGFHRLTNPLPLRADRALMISSRALALDLINADEFAPLEESILRDIWQSNWMPKKNSVYAVESEIKGRPVDDLFVTTRRIYVVQSLCLSLARMPTEAEFAECHKAAMTLAVEEFQATARRLWSLMVVCRTARKQSNLPAFAVSLPKNNNTIASRADVKSNEQVADEVELCESCITDEVNFERLDPNTMVDQLRCLCGHKHSNHAFRSVWPFADFAPST